MDSLNIILGLRMVDVDISGWQVGSDPEIQVATLVSNHLTAGIMKYFGDSGRLQQAANLFEKLATRDPEVASLLAKSYIGMSESPICPRMVDDTDCRVRRRRGSQGRADHGGSHEGHAAVVHLASRPM
jgi:hypothetical protein